MNLFFLLIYLFLLDTGNAAFGDNLKLHTKHSKQHFKRQNNNYNISTHSNYNPKKHYIRKKHTKPINILLILADDLGYGDTSVSPFTGSGVMTPELEKMAANGVVMTNFHTASATCTPTRASILTGLYPWRLGIKGVFEYGEKGYGKGNRNDFLPLMPTAAMTFKHYNYTTLHSGKWHLGGMRNDDLDMRRLEKPIKIMNINGTYTEEEYKGNTKGKRRCPHPGPNQQGFMDYVSVLDGPGSPRQNYLQVEDKLYSHGCQHLLYNDKDVKDINDYKNIKGYLSYCEASHAMRMMNETVAKGQPFYMHLWFHAPHGPWQEIPGYDHLYPDQVRPINSAGLKACTQRNNVKDARFCKGMNGQIVDLGVNRFDKYKTMITDMDRSIGMVLRNLKALDIERETLVVFLSDNGPEDFAGTTAGLKGNKRFIYEGGIRVPAIFQWVDTIPKGKQIHSFGVSTDLYPTFLDVAGLDPPATVRLDGMSLLPELTGTSRKRYKKVMNERITLWHNDYEGPRKTALWTYDYKIIINDKELPEEMYDMLTDPHEKNNLLFKIPKEKYINFAKKCINDKFDNNLMAKSLKLMNISNFNRNKIIEDRNNSDIHLSMVTKLFQTLYNFAQYGNEAHIIYTSNNNGRIYDPTLRSDNRPIRVNIYKKHTPNEVDRLHKLFIEEGFCKTYCDCETPDITFVNSLPFDNIYYKRKYINPNGFLNGTFLLS